MTSARQDPPKNWPNWFWETAKRQLNINTVVVGFSLGLMMSVLKKADSIYATIIRTETRMETLIQNVQQVQMETKNLSLRMDKIEYRMDRDEILMRERKP